MKKLISLLLIAVMLLTVLLPAAAMAYSKDDVKRNLNVGMSGDDVTAAQERLAYYGYYSGSVDGIYSEDVKMAALRFQRANGLKTDGKVGPQTWAKLIKDDCVDSDHAPTSGNYVNEDLKRIIVYGMSGSDVKNVQERLFKYGYYTGTLSGQFGNELKQAVIAFQRANGLKQDGKVGPNTWNVLISDTGIKKADDTTGSKRVQYGDTGDLVKQAQARLSYYGYYQGEINGKFGNEMEQAVISFQRRNGLSTDGVIGTKTWAVLDGNTGVKFSDPGFETIEKGMSGDDVKTIQFYLKYSYCYDGDIDGKFGAEVYTAVKLFQKIAGLTVDGKVGEKTWAYLVDGDAPIFHGGMPIRDLSRTDRGYDVYVLQDKLESLNYLTTVCRYGYYDDATVQAVKAFQKANHITESGNLDNSTRRYLWTSQVNDKEEQTIIESGSKHEKLRLGSHGKEVSNAQMKLKSGGYLLGNADGIFGEETKKAVIALQKRYGLYPDGVIGEDTWSLLDSFDVSFAEQELVDGSKTSVGTSTRKLYAGCGGKDVTKLQQQLASLSYLSDSDVDGRFGPITKAAVIAFQADHGLVQDGVVGVKTFVALYEELGNP